MSETDPNAAAAGQAPKADEHDTAALLAHKAALEADLKKERDRRRALEDAAAEAARKDEMARAQTKEELAATIAKYEADTARQVRAAALEVAAARNGINEAFLARADDGKASPDEVLTRARELQEEHNKRVLAGMQTTTLGGGSSPSPHAGDKRIFKTSEFDASTPGGLAFYKANRAAILLAQAEGRVVKG